MSEFTFLTKEQVFAGKKKLDIIKEYGSKCAITDFSILLGGYVSSFSCTSEGNTRKDRTGMWWTNTRGSGSRDVYAVDNYGSNHFYLPGRRNGGARPALPYSSISSISSNGVSGANGIKEIEYGEYPQTIVDALYSCTLEGAYNNRRLRTTGKSYTVKPHDDGIKFRNKTLTEFEYRENKYIRFIGDSDCAGEVLSDGRTIEEGKPYWVVVEPITWLVDEKADIALSKKIIFSGVQFDNNFDRIIGFKKTFIYNYMNNIFAKDIIPSSLNINEEDYFPKENEYIDSNMNKEEKLKSLYLDNKSLEDFRKKIKKVDKEESDKLGEELHKIIKMYGESEENLEKITELIYKGANVNYKESKKGNFPLLLSTRNGKKNYTYLLLRAGADVNLTNNYNTTATMAAARHGYTDLLETFILLGADVNIQCIDGDTALFSAKLHSKQECFDLLVKNGAYLTHRNLVNKSILDIDGKIDFDYSTIDSEQIYLSKNKGNDEESAKNLVEEARQKLKSLKER